MSGTQSERVRTLAEIDKDMVALEAEFKRACTDAVQFVAEHFVVRKK